MAVNGSNKKICPSGKSCARCFGAPKGRGWRHRLTAGQVRRMLTMAEELRALRRGDR